MTEPGRCSACGRAALARCDQCGVPVCGGHRHLIETELGKWSRCRPCFLRNRIKESPLVTYYRWQNEVRLFFLWVWLLVALALGSLTAAYQWLAGGPK